MRTHRFWWKGCYISNPALFSQDWNVVSMAILWVPGRSPNAKSLAIIHYLKKKRFISFDNAIDEGNLSSFLLLWTETGINDVLSQLDHSTAKSIHRAIIRVGRTDTLLGDIRHAEPYNFQAFIIVRGGDDNTMEIWNDPEVVSFLMHYDIPFYTALGHSHSRTLADQYADGSYPTPTAFGSALQSILSGKRRFKEMEAEYARLKQEYILLANATQAPPTPAHQGHDWVKIAAIFGTCLFLAYLVVLALTKWS